MALTAWSADQRATLHRLEFLPHFCAQGIPLCARRYGNKPREQPVYAQAVHDLADGANVKALARAGHQPGDVRLRQPSQFGKLRLGRTRGVGDGGKHDLPVPLAGASLPGGLVLKLPAGRVVFASPIPQQVRDHRVRAHV